LIRLKFLTILKITDFDVALQRTAKSSFFFIFVF